MPIKEQTFTIKELDSLVMTVELTLVSIVQGVALSVLVGPAVAALTGLDLALFPYVASGLVVILLFWSRSLMHTFTVIRWPLEFGHNFLYIVSTLLESAAFSQLASPPRWYALTSIYGLSIWLLFALDLRMIRRRLAESNLPGALALLREVHREQLFNARLLMPATVVFNAAAAYAIYRDPRRFIDGQWHALFGLAQLLAALGYLAYTVRFYKRLLPLIVAAQYEWNGEEMPKSVTGDR